MKEEKSEIEKLINKIYHKQTYGKDIDKDLERLNELLKKKTPPPKGGQMIFKTKKDQRYKEEQERWKQYVGRVDVVFAWKFLTLRNGDVAWMCFVHRKWGVFEYSGHYYKPYVSYYYVDNK